MCHPDLLLLDEPLSALDQPSRDELRGVLQDLLSDLGIPAIHVTHDREEALTLADRVAVIVGGRLRQTEAPQDIALHPSDADVARLVGWVELGHGTVREGRIALGDIELRADARSGTAAVFYRPEGLVLGPAPATGTPAVRLRRTIAGIRPTVPLARVLIAGDPPLTALALQRALSQLGVRPGEAIDVHFPADALKTFIDAL